MIRRHDFIVTRLATLARACGCPVSVEPRLGLPSTTVPRPDLVILTTHGPVYVDVADTTKSIKKMESSKSSDYAVYIAAQRAKFFLFVVNPFGSMGVKAVELLRLLATEATINYVSKESSSYLLHAMAVAVQKANLVFICSINLAMFD